MISPTSELQTENDSSYEENHRADDSRLHRKEIGGDGLCDWLLPPARPPLLFGVRCHNLNFSAQRLSAPTGAIEWKVK